MLAIIRNKAGKDFSTMQVQDLPSPTAGPDEIKIRMAASRINPADMDLMKGMPFLKYKNPQIGGLDGAGTVVETGAHVSWFKAGDPVIFYRKFTNIGAWAEEITLKEAYCAKVPSRIAPAEAGAIALPLLTAFDSLAQLAARPGEKILIHGAGGGVGFQAVQVAKKMGLYVIGTAGAGDKEILGKAGVDRIIDYKTQAFEQLLKAGEVDYVFDLVGGAVLMKSIALQPKKIISVHYIDPAKMYKVGIELPGTLKWIMKLGMRKYDKAAQANGVQLIGQVTGADGLLLQKALDFVGDGLLTRPWPTRTLADIAAKGMSKADVGKVIVF